MKFKYIVLVGDGMADYPLTELKGLTPLEAARKPNLNFLVKNGILGLIKTTPQGMVPGTDVANLSILGYDPARFYSGRGPLEAMNFGIKIRKGDLVFRCNLVTVGNGRLIDYSAGHIATEQARVLIKKLDRELGSSLVRFYPGVSYRHLVVFRHLSRIQKRNLLNLKCMPPHDVMGHPLKEILPEGKGAELLHKLMFDSQKILESQSQWKSGKCKANMIWLWGQGERPKMPSFYKKYGLKGAVISAVDIVKGIGRAIGLDVINVPGATGYYDTDYQGKATYALNALKKNDFVFVHVEAPDEAGHNGDIRQKIKAIENFDKKVLGTIIKGMKKFGNYKILVLTDHPTPISLRTHTSDPVPFVIYKKEGSMPFENNPENNSGINFDEKNAERSRLFFTEGYRLMKFFLTFKN